MANRRISQPVFLSPWKPHWEPCVFKKGCERECMHKKPPEFSDLVKKRLNREVAYWIKMLRENKGCCWEMRNDFATELTRLLEGSAVPIGNVVGNGEYFGCGKEKPGLGLRLMQAYKSEDVREATAGISLEVPLNGAYASSASSIPTGLNFPFSMFLARVAARGLGGDGWALKALETEGGLNGMRTLALMAAEPTVPFHIRESFIESLEKIANCASFETEESKKLAAAVSRFSTMEEVIGVYEGHVAAKTRYGKNAPEMPNWPDFAKARQMCMFAFNSIFQAMMNLSARIDAIFCCSDIAVLKNKNLIAGYCLNLEKAIYALAGRKGPNKGLFLHASELIKKKNEGVLAEAPRNEQELYIGEHILARQAVMEMKKEGSLDPERADALLGLLCKKEPEEGWEMLRKAEEFSKTLEPQ